MWWREGAALQGLLFRFAHVHRRVNAGRLGTVRRQREFRHDVTGRPQQFVSNILCAHSHLQTCLDTFALFVQSCRYSTSWTPDDERNGRSKHVELYKNCRINTYRKCILLVCLCNWLRCTVHTMSKSCSIFLDSVTVSVKTIRRSKTSVPIRRKLQQFL